MNELSIVKVKLFGVNMKMSGMENVNNGGCWFCIHLCAREARLGWGDGVIVVVIIT